MARVCVKVERETVQEAAGRRRQKEEAIECTTELACAPTHPLTPFNLALPISRQRIRCVGVVFCLFALYGGTTGFWR